MWKQICKHEILVKSILEDLLVGLAATALEFFFAYYSFKWRGLGTIVVAVCLLFTIAGFLRGNSIPKSSWLKALMLISVFVLLHSLLRLSAMFYMGILTVVAFGSSLIGVRARRDWSAGAQNRSLFILGATFAVAEIAAIFGAPILLQRLTTRTVNFPAPEVSFMGLNGRSVESAKLRGHVVVLYFWASWCPPCWREFPQLENLYDEKYETNSYVKFLTIDTRGNGESPEKAKAFMASAGYRIPAAFDDRGEAVRFRLRAFPSVLILDRSWHVRLVHVGYDGSEHYVENLSKEIDSLLEE
jgi:thiol-disulfide isomerase/thioredoxin